MRERRPGKGASLGKEAVLAASGRAGEVAAGVGRVRRATFSFQHPVRRGVGVASGSRTPAVTEEGPMECTRCDGLMVADNLIDIQESSIPMWMKGWRCVSCGNIVDPLIQQHRMIQQAGAVQLLGTEAAMPRLRHALKATA